jgi:hypothetical protein
LLAKVLKNQAYRRLSREIWEQVIRVDLWSPVDDHTAKVKYNCFAKRI